ncbi:MAG: hypothetical protein AAGG09_19930 [Pseudomonadota bacterium]
MRILTTAALLLTLLPAIAHAEARASFAEGNRTLFSFELPDFWSLRAGGERILTLPEGGDPRGIPQILSLHPTVDPTVWMAFFSPPGVTTLAEGREYMREIGQFLANAPQLTDERTRSIAGLPAQVIRGTGQRGRTALQFTVALIDLPGPRIAVGAAVIEAGAPDSAYDAVNDIFASFRAGS